MEPAPPAPLVRLAFLDFERRLRMPKEAAAAAFAHFDAVKAGLTQDLGLEYLAVSGSYGHGTDIRGGSDIDLIAQFPRHRLAADSRVCLTTVANALRARFRHADVGIDPPAVVVRFPDSETPLDVIPARRVTGLDEAFPPYEIPAGRGRWKLIHVDHHKRYVAVADELLGYDVKKVIRILKAWNHLRGYGFSSIFLELFVASYYRTAAGIPPVLERRSDVKVFRIGVPAGGEPYLTAVDFASDIWGLLGLLVERRLRGMRDPTGLAGTVAAFRGDAEVARILAGVEEDWQVAESALRFENSGELATALTVWQVFFRDLFLDPAGPTVEMPPDLGPEVAALVTELSAIWARTGRYLAVDGEPDRRVVQIGRRLDAKGGWRLLGWAADQVRTQAGEDAVSELSWAWNDIGSWQA